jgi:uncharacterized coiled-coil protein SlyX
MRHLRFLVPCFALIAAAACDTKAKEQLRVLAKADSLRTDSLVAIKNDLLNEVMTSTQFVNDINSQLSKMKFAANKDLNTKTGSEGDLAKIKEDRTIIVSKIRELVARLDSSENRLTSLRKRANALAKHDSTLVGQVAAYEQTINELRQTVETQKAEFQSIIDRQNTQIAQLTSKVDTMTTENVRLAGERAAYVDTVSKLTTEKNTAYYVIGTRDELMKKGILVNEGRRRFISSSAVVPRRWRVISIRRSSPRSIASRIGRSTSPTAPSTASSRARTRPSPRRSPRRTARSPAGSRSSSRSSSGSRRSS